MGVEVAQEASVECLAIQRRLEVSIGQGLALAVTIVVQVGTDTVLGRPVEVAVALHWVNPSVTVTV